MHGRSRTTFIAAIAALASLAFAVPARANPTGEITTATRYSDWSVGSFSGSASFDETSCPGAPCNWRAELTTQSIGCAADPWPPASSESVLTLWSSEIQMQDGTVSFDEHDRALLPGVADQRLCLYIAYTSPVVQGEIAVIAASRTNFTIADPPPPGDGGGGGGSGGGGGGAGAVSPGTGTQVQTNPPAATLSSANALAKAKAALKKKFGRAYRKGKKKHLSCAKQSATVYRCSFSFRNRKKKRSGTVTVRQTASGIKTTLKSR
jgi:hypothetical protein